MTTVSAPNGVALGGLHRWAHGGRYVSDGQGIRRPPFRATRKFVSRAAASRREAGNSPSVTDAVGGRRTHLRNFPGAISAPESPPRTLYSGIRGRGSYPGRHASYCT